MELPSAGYLCASIFHFAFSLPAIGLALPAPHKRPKEIHGWAGQKCHVHWGQINIGIGCSGLDFRGCNTVERSLTRAGSVHNWKL